MKKILLISLIASQLVWNISDVLVRESWLTEEQSEQDFSKESSKKEKEISFESFFKTEFKSLPISFRGFILSDSLSFDVHEVKVLDLPAPCLKISLYLLQSCIRI